MLWSCSGQRFLGKGTSPLSLRLKLLCWLNKEEGPHLPWWKPAESPHPYSLWRKRETLLERMEGTQSPAGSAAWTMWWLLSTGKPGGCAERLSQQQSDLLLSKSYWVSCFHFCSIIPAQLHQLSTSRSSRINFNNSLWRSIMPSTLK